MEGAAPDLPRREGGGVVAVPLHVRPGAEHAERLAPGGTLEAVQAVLCPVEADSERQAEVPDVREVDAGVPLHGDGVSCVRGEAPAGDEGSPARVWPAHVLAGRQRLGVAAMTLTLRVAWLWAYGRGHGHGHGHGFGHGRGRGRGRWRGLGFGLGRGLGRGREANPREA
jgi:hypothetical protein